MLRQLPWAYKKPNQSSGGKLTKEDDIEAQDIDDSEEGVKESDLAVMD